MVQDPEPRKGNLGETAAAVLPGDGRMDASVQPSNDGTTSEDATILDQDAPASDPPAA